MIDVYRAFLLTLDKLLEKIKNQMLGFVVIVDWTNFTYRQSTHLSPKILKLMIEGLQVSMKKRIQLLFPRELRKVKIFKTESNLNFERY